MWLLIADLCCAKVCEEPNFAQVATAIDIIKSRAHSGLKMLDYLSISFAPGRNQTSEQAFTEFDNYIEKELTSEEKVNFTWNCITAEHTLCKLSRMSTDHYKAV